MIKPGFVQVPALTAATLLSSNVHQIKANPNVHQINADQTNHIFTPQNNAGTQAAAASQVFPPNPPNVTAVVDNEPDNNENACPDSASLSATLDIDGDNNATNNLNSARGSGNLRTSPTNVVNKSSKDGVLNQSFKPKSTSPVEINASSFPNSTSQNENHCQSCHNGFSKRITEFDCAGNVSAYAGADSNSPGFQDVEPNNLFVTAGQGPISFNKDDGKQVSEEELLQSIHDELEMASEIGSTSSFNESDSIATASEQVPGNNFQYDVPAGAPTLGFYNTLQESEIVQKKRDASKATTRTRKSTKNSSKQSSKESTFTSSDHSKQTSMDGTNVVKQTIWKW